MSTGHHRKDSSSGERWKRWLLPAVVVLVVGGLYAASYTPQVRESLKATLVRIKGLGIWGNVIFGVIYVLACVFMVSGAALTLGAGAIYGLLWGTVTVSVASTLGATAAFIVGRTVMRGWIAAKVQGSRKFRAIDEAIGREGFKIVLLTRLSPMFPFVLLNYLFGITKVRFWTCLLASWIGMLPGTIMYVYLGWGLGSLAALSAAPKETSLAQKILFWVGLVPIELH